VTHPDQLTGADVFGVPDASLSPTGPDELVAWLRALPVGAVLLDRNGDVWQRRDHGGWRSITDEFIYSIEDFRGLTGYAPFRLIWSSGGGR